MNKETIFISHASKDKEAMNYFQKLLREKTSSTFDIFLSSDGQSIPFGTNWIYKIKDGLDNAKIMFVFITSNSVKSSWIYFEAGYAYSKGIRVIPIGVGIDINTIKPPLNLLQGFNINSFEGMNNCIKIINDEFNNTFKEDISSEEYQEFVALMDQNKTTNEVKNMINYVQTYIEDDTNYNGNISINADEILNKCKDIIEKNKYKYTYNKNRILSLGFEIDKINMNRIDISINSDEFDEIFDILKEIIDESYQNKKTHYINIILSERFEIETDRIKVSSFIKKSKDIEFSNDGSMAYKYKDINFNLTLENYGRHLDPIFQRVLKIWFSSNTKVSRMMELITILKDIGVIYKKSES